MFLALKWFQLCAKARVSRAVRRHGKGWCCLCVCIVLAAGGTAGGASKQLGWRQLLPKVCCLSLGTRTLSPTHFHEASSAQYMCRALW